MEPLPLEEPPLALESLCPSACPPPPLESMALPLAWPLAPLPEEGQPPTFACLPSPLDTPAPPLEPRPAPGSSLSSRSVASLEWVSLEWVRAWRESVPAVEKARWHVQHL